MTRLIDADALINTLNEENIPVDVRVNYEIMNAPTIEPDVDTISRSQAIKDVSEWATDILHLDRLVKEDAIHILESLPSAEQVTGKLKNPCDSLLTADSEACKEQKSKLDLISRQDAIRKCCGEKCGCEREDCGYTECCSEVSRLERLPSAPDSRQRGEWVDNHNGTFVCDQCGCKHSKSNFCPNCGADMRGEEE